MKLYETYVSDYTDDGSCLYCGSDQGDKCKCTATLTPYGYGIVDKNGNPWWDEACVCQDIEPMQDMCEELNNLAPINWPSRYPFRVVQLLYRELQVCHVERKPRDLE